MTDDRVATAPVGGGRTPEVADASIPAPLRLHRATVPPAWVDYNGHMSESCYLLAFGDSADAFFRYLGIDEHYRDAGHSLYTVETHLHHRREVGEGELLSMTLRVLDHDDKRVHVFHEMLRGDSDVLLATAEQMLVHVDSRAGRSAPMPRDLTLRLGSIRRAHAVLALPEAVGRPMRIKRA
nr:thioesterase family protein [Nocardioidaceae bacterium]